MKKLLFITLSFFILLPDVKSKSKTDYKDWALKIAQTQLKHNPELWMSDFVKTPKWDYTQGLIAKSLMELYLFTNDKKYYEYVKEFADFFVNDNGEIKTYKVDDYNIDRLNGGNFLFDIYNQTRNVKYLKAIELLRSQLKTHPRVSEGAFWHKKVYPHQIWLDGLYMGSPFYCRYAAIFDKPTLFDDVYRQFKIADKYTLDPKTGLNYHGWDESKTQKWANTKTGQSPNFWSRSIGWYMMAIVDVLDYFPIDHPNRPDLILILNRLSNNLLKFQDKKTSMWYQVTNMPKKKGNYLESTGTIMYCYAMAKGANKGYLPKKFKTEAEKIFNGITKYSTQANEDGTISITRCCSVAGLGGNPYRDGSYEYYISEPVRNDDPKAVGPFILAAIELAK
jgi:unsaturated rhamnogalacturonyl hydrolase